MIIRKQSFDMRLDIVEVMKRRDWFPITQGTQIDSIADFRYRKLVLSIDCWTSLF